MLRFVFLILGTAFGYILIRAGVSSYDVIRDMFLLKSWHMYGVLGIAVPVSFLGIQLWKKLLRQPLLGGETEWNVEKLSKNHVVGGLISGAGWALTGACPGPALAILGYGLYSGAFIVLGIFLGTYVYAWLEEKRAR
ncbi:MAG: YeeE/YedE family protein [Spirochaetes bacterium]|nr:YeeE/YedE family protein [Spirochaetota bacterium]